MGAREAIIITLVESGWIRARNYEEAGMERWSLSMPAVDAGNLARVCAFFQRLYPDAVSYAPVSLWSIGGTGESTVDALLQCKPVAGRTINPDTLPDLIYVTSPEQMPGFGIPEIRL